ncbi:Protein CBG15907 [Caenorhabditis briggsae]|uniref:Protein CBG15907 n=1 Tax=Caenorhabditis briggsae TaxID=6238 RepID=A8XN17_CAEBR|nr:Protein CBG15907 [Caenorhabditis briggsae]CAP34043.2 Protein CBG15907 [Caenorhabditis briggsae]
MVTIPLILLSLLCISAIVPDCKNGKIVFDSTSPKPWYPANFSVPGPVFPANFNCEFQIKVPQGWYARVELSLISPDNSQSSAVIFDQLDRSETVFFADPEYFYFIANGGRIQFSTDSNETNFGFQIFWHEYQNSTLSVGRVNASDTVPLIRIPDDDGSMLISAETKPWLLFQDYEITKNIKSFQGEHCNNRNLCGSITLDATNGPAALQIYNKDGVDVISDLSGSGQLEVYIGTASQNKTNLVATYHAGETSSSLPQKVFGYFKTFLLTDGNATITFDDTYTREEMYGSVGSTGFISSDNYGTYNASNPPQLNSYDEFIGTSMPANFGDRGLWSKGMLIRYEVEKSSNCIFMFLSFVFVLIVNFDC